MYAGHKHRLQSCGDFTYKLQRAPYKLQAVNQQNGYLCLVQFCFTAMTGNGKWKLLSIFSVGALNITELDLYFYCVPLEEVGPCMV